MLMSVTCVHCCRAITSVWLIWSSLVLSPSTVGAQRMELRELHGYIRGDLYMVWVWNCIAGNYLIVSRVSSISKNSFSIYKYKKTAILKNFCHEIHKDDQSAKNIPSKLPAIQFIAGIAIHPTDITKVFKKLMNMHNNYCCNQFFLLIFFRFSN